MKKSLIIWVPTIIMFSFIFHKLIVSCLTDIVLWLIFIKNVDIKIITFKSWCLFILKCNLWISEDVLYKVYATVKNNNKMEQMIYLILYFRIFLYNLNTENYVPISNKPYTHYPPVVYGILV